MKKLLLLTFLVLSGVAMGDMQVICRLNAGANASLLAAKYNLKYLDNSFFAPFYLFSTSASEHDNSLRQLRLDPEVAWVEDDVNIDGPNVQKGSVIGAVGDFSVLYAENTQPLLQVKWNSTLVNQPGRLVRMAILDTGLSPYQPSVWSHVFTYINLVEPNTAPYDLPPANSKMFPAAVGHGTMVAGIAAMVAPKVQLVIVRVADTNGVSTTWRLIKGLAFATGTHCEVANISLGSPNEIPSLEDVLGWTEQQGLLVVAPDGNMDTDPAESPARLETVVAVAGVDPTDHKASFSNWDGRTLCSAPATGIKSMWWNGHMAAWSGTSFAAPFVSAAIADAMRKLPYRSPEEIRRVIRSSGDPIDSLNPAWAGQLGTRLNVAKLESAISQLPADEPPGWEHGHN